TVDRAAERELVDRAVPRGEPRLRRGDELGRRVQADPEAVRRQPDGVRKDRGGPPKLVSEGGTMLRMTRDMLLDLYRRCGALLEGHFRLTSGLHSSGYLQCALVLQHPQHAEALGRAIAAKFDREKATVVLSPALGGLIIGHEVARALGVRAIFAERQDAA